MVDISLGSKKQSFPRFRYLHIREQLLLQVVIICLIALSASLFAIWGLYRTGALLRGVQGSIRPAGYALLLAKELEHAYGLSEAYQLSFNQPEQRQAISEEIKQSTMKLWQYQQGTASSGRNFAATVRSFLRSVHNSQERADKFAPLFDLRNQINEHEEQIEVRAIEYFNQRVSNETTLETSKRLNQIIIRLQDVHNTLMRIGIQQQPLISKEYSDIARRRFEQVAADEQQMIGVLTDAHEYLMAQFRTRLESQSAQFNSAIASLGAVLADPAGLPDADAASVRTAIAQFKKLFGDPRKPTDAATYLGNALLRGELMSEFRLNSILQRVLVLRLSKDADEIVASTQQRITNAADTANSVWRRAVSAAAILLAASVGLTIMFVIFVVDRNILRRLNDITRKMRVLARGEAIAVTGADRADELGEMARALQVFWKAELERREFQHQLELANKELQREVDDSICVAQRIQNALLRGQLPDGPWLSDQGLLSRPCKLLGGDSYWLERFDDGYVVALIDCTGHGVPGAMMTIVTSIYLNAILHQEGLRDPAEILLRLAEYVQNSLLDKSEDASFDAGFDAAICFVDLHSGRLRYAGGGIPLIVFDGSSARIQILKGNGFGIDRTTIGSGPCPVTREVELRPGMRFYLTSDGLVTQPNDACGVGFGWTRLVELLRETRDLPLTEQNERVWLSFREYSANAEQRDDLTIIAFAT